MAKKRKKGNNWKKKRFWLGLFSAPFIIHTVAFLGKIVAPRFLFLVFEDLLIVLVSIQNWGWIWKLSLIAFIALLWSLFAHPTKKIRQVEKKIAVSLDTLFGLTTIIGFLALFYFVSRFGWTKFLDTVTPFIALVFIVIPTIYYLGKKIKWRRYFRAFKRKNGRKA